MAIDKILGNGALDQVADSVFSAVSDSVSEIKAMQKRKAAENVQVVIQALKKIESDLQDKYDGVTTVLEKRVASIKDGRDGQNGVDGRAGKDGRPGRDGAVGPRGANGIDGRNGRDGVDGVSVVNANIDFDGSLIISLSNGRTINVGEVVAPDLAERIKVITNGGGTSQGVLDAIAALQATIATYGTMALQNASAVAITGGAINGTTIGATTPSTGAFTTLSAAGNTILSNVNVLGASYDSVSFSVAGEELTPSDLFFSPDGLKMYIIGTTGDDVNEYNLSTAWVVSSAVFVTNFSVVSQDTSPQGLFFRADGTKMYMVGSTNDTVYQYTLSTPWSVATASYDSISFSVAAEANPNGLWFRPNGLSMYMVGAATDLVYQYTLSTAWNISTATFLQSFSVTGQETTSTAVTFTSDGSRMFVMGQTGDDVNVYNLTTPWDISTAAFVGVFSVSGQETAPVGLYIKPDGTKMYIVGQTNDTVYQYTVPSIDIQLTGPTSAAALDVQQDLNVYGNTTGSFLNNGFRENIGGQYYNLVSQADIGTAPNKIPLNQYLGEMAYMNAESVVIQPQASAVPNGIGDMVFQLTSDTSLEIKVKGSDGTVRSVTLTLA